MTVLDVVTLFARVINVLILEKLLLIEIVQNIDWLEATATISSQVITQVTHHPEENPIRAPYLLHNKCVIDSMSE